MPPFGEMLLGHRAEWESRISASELERPNKIVLLAGSGAATVALGTFGTMLVQKFAGEVAYLPGPDGEARLDPIIAFANRLDMNPTSSEAAYRAATWAFVAEMAAFFWRPNYEIEMYRCAEAFEFRNEHEGEIARLGEPAPTGSPVEVEGARKHRLVKGSLTGMVSAAVGEPVDDDPFLTMYVPIWHDQFNDGMAVGKEVIQQHAPEGLPIWDD